MKTIRKFFNKGGEETTAKDAVSCHELELDDDGCVVRDSIYHATEEVTKGDGPSYSCTMLMMPEHVCKAVKKVQKGIAVEDLMAKGLEKEHHVTLLFGTHTDDVEEIKAALAEAELASIRFKIGKLSSFPPSPYSDGAAVLKYDVTGVEVKAANKALSSLEHTSSFKTYKAHMTVAYVDPAAVDKYVGSDFPIDSEFVADEVMFSTSEREKTTFNLSELVAKADVSNEARDDKGRWTKEDSALSPDEVAEKYVLSSVKPAVEAIVERVFKNPFDNGRYVPGEMPTPEKVASNWKRTFKGTDRWKSYDKETPAFHEIRPSTIEAVKGAVISNANNPLFKEFTDTYGHMPVIVRNPEKGRGAYGEYIGGITHLYDHKWQEDKATGPITLGKGTVGGDALDTVLRHEFAHGIYHKLSIAGLTEWASFYHANRETFGTALSFYAKHNDTEGFCETFSAMTHPEFEANAGEFAKSAATKLREVLDK